MTTAEKWDLITESSDDDAFDRFLVAKVTKKLRTKWAQTETVVVQYKHGSSWPDAGLGISMPESREHVTPEGGARALVTMAREYSDSRDHDVRIQLQAFGESQSGQSAKSLWRMGLDFTPQDPDEQTPREGKAKATEEVAVMESMRQMMETAFSHWGEAMVKAEAMADKLIEISANGGNNYASLLEIIKVQAQDNREAREAEAEQEERKATNRRLDQLWDKGMDTGWRLIEDVLRKKGGLGSDVFDGTFSTRLAALLKKVPDDKKGEAKEVLGEDVWQLLEDAAKGVNDDAFRELVRQMAAKMPPGNHSDTFKLLATKLDPALVMAMGKLLAEAS